jgi:hypothetical protein
MHTIQPRTATERSAYITDRLNAGERLRTAEIAAVCGMTRQGAYRLMEGVSAVVPVLLYRGEWQRLPRQRGVDIDVLE